MILNSEDYYQPHMIDIESEEAVIGSIIYNNQCYSEIAGDLGMDDFFKNENKHVFSAIETLFQQEQPADELTIGDILKTRGLLEQCGGYQYLANFVDCVPSSANIKRYAGILREKSAKRKTVDVSINAINSARDIKTMSADVIDEIENHLGSIQTGNKKTGLVKLSDYLPEVFENLEKVTANPTDVPGMGTGLVDLDKHLGGLMKTDFVVVGARPGTGKTIFGLEVTKAIKNDEVVVIFSLEMSKEQLALRLLCSQSGVDNRKIKTGQMEDYDWDNFTNAVNYLSPKEIYICDDSSLNILEIKDMIQRKNMELEAKGKRKIDLAVLDYIQLMQKTRETMSEVDHIGQISKTGKLIAKKFNLCFIGLSQLNRKLEERRDKRPIISDLKGASQIEQDADIIIMLYRDEMYNEDSKDRGIIEIIMRKFRNGTPGTVKAVFQGQYTRFANLSNY